MNNEKVEERIKNTQDLTTRIMEALLKSKEKKLSYADIASFLARSFAEFEKDTKEESNIFYKDNLKDKSPELVCSMTTFSLFTKLLGDLLCYSSPEEAKKITDLLSKDPK